MRASETGGGRLSSPSAPPRAVASPGPGRPRRRTVRDARPTRVPWTSGRARAGRAAAAGARSSEGAGPPPRRSPFRPRPTPASGDRRPRPEAGGHARGTGRMRVQNISDVKKLGMLGFSSLAPTRMHTVRWRPRALPRSVRALSLSVWRRHPGSGTQSHKLGYGAAPRARALRASATPRVR